MRRNFEEHALGRAREKRLFVSEARKPFQQRLTLAFWVVATLLVMANESGAAGFQDYFAFLASAAGAALIGGVAAAIAAAVVSALAFTIYDILHDIYETRGTRDKAVDAGDGMEFHREAEAIVRSFCNLLDRHPNNSILDGSLLPHPKERVKEAIRLEWALAFAADNEQLQNILACLYQDVSRFQDGVGDKSIELFPEIPRILVEGEETENVELELAILGQWAKACEYSETLRGKVLAEQQALFNEMTEFKRQKQSDPFLLVMRGSAGATPKTFRNEGTAEEVEKRGPVR